MSVAATIAATIKMTTETLSGVKSAEVLRERVALLKEQIDMLQKIAVDAETKLAEKEKEIEGLKNELSAYREADQFVEYKGGLFKKDPAGGYAEAVYCPHCRKPAGGSFPNFPLQCTSCKWIAPIKVGQVKRLVAELTAKNT